MSTANDVDARYPSADELMVEATQETGLTDFGPGGDFVEGLEVLLESLRRDAGLDPSTDPLVVGDIRRRLANRLLLEDWYAQHPEIDDLPVRGPVDINGLPRTGTTALANMLALDPQFRSLRGWEQKYPVPPPVLGQEEHDWRRQALIEENANLPAELHAMHIYEVDATMEDGETLGLSFHGQQYTLPVYGYHEWWRQCDMTDAFAHHRRTVKVLQSQRPPDLWLYKAPHHNFHLEPLLAAYPDAKFVMTHRDPVKSVPSWASIVSTIFPTSAEPFDLHRCGHEVSNHLRTGVEHAIAARARIGEDRFLDVYHRELVRDPLPVVRRVYEWLELELTPAVLDLIRGWQETNNASAHGSHRYTPEQFGLTAAQLRSDYRFYTDHFDVELEVDV
jgi:hypothetical protein